MTTPPATPTEQTIPAPDPAHRLGAWFWAGVLVGGTLIGIGVVGALLDSRDTHPDNLILWFGGSLLAHDAVLAPLFVAVAWATKRLPEVARAPVRVGLAVSFVLTLMTWPLVRGWGRSPSVPSALPLDYDRNLVVVLMLLWLATLTAIAVRIGRRRTRRRP